MKSALHSLRITWLILLIFSLSCDGWAREPDKGNFPVLDIDPTTGRIAWVTPGPFLHYRLVVLNANLSEIDDILISTERVRSVNWSNDGRSILVSTHGQEVKEYSISNNELEAKNSYRLSGRIITDAVSVDNIWYVVYVEATGAHEGNVGIYHPTSGNLTRIGPERSLEPTASDPYLQIEAVSGRTGPKIVMRGIWSCKVIGINPPGNVGEISPGPSIVDTFAGMTISGLGFIICSESEKCGIYDIDSLSLVKEIKLDSGHLRGVATSPSHLYWFVRKRPMLYRKRLTAPTKNPQVCQLRSVPRVIHPIGNGVLVGYPNGGLDRVGAESWGDKACPLIARYNP
ncbi:MAG: hypothetical protein RH862_12155 [Leptospiraceae bacterium]